MADTNSHIKCTDQDFLTSARTRRKDLLRIPVHRVAEVLPFFTVRPGIRYEEKVMDIDADMQFGPYDPKRTQQLDVNFGARVLKTYFGSVRREFDPNEYYKTVLGSAITKGEALKGVEIARRVLSIVAGKLGNHLCRHIFDAVRKDDGTTTVELFNGLDTITGNEITAGNISADKGNLYAFTEKIDKTNAVDAITEFCRSADDFLIDTEGLNLLMPWEVYYAYLDDYKATTGAIPYNQQFKQLHPEGFENITFRPMFQKKNSKFMQLAKKDNLLIGVNQMGEEENIVVEKHDVVMLTFFATMFFGCDYESIVKERLLIGKLYEKPASTGGGDSQGGTSQQPGS